MEKEDLINAIEDALGMLAIGESAKANDILTKSIGIHYDHYGFYSGEGEE